MSRRRWRLTRNQQAWMCAIAWTVAIGICIASVLVEVAPPAVKA